MIISFEMYKWIKNLCVNKEDLLKSVIKFLKLIPNDCYGGGEFIKQENINSLVGFRASGHNLIYRNRHDYSFGIYYGESLHYWVGNGKEWPGEWTCIAVIPDQLPQDLIEAMRKNPL